MNITSNQIDRWLSSPTETEHLEFKAARNNYSVESVCEYAVAISNEGGGHLLLGVTDDVPRQVVGTTAFSNVSEASHTFFQKLGFRLDLTEVTHPSGRVLVFGIPARPVGVPLEFKGRYLMRVGQSLTSMTQDRLLSIFN
jgi:ATP-dependent DNA helicase RecG